LVPPGASFQPGFKVPALFISASLKSDLRALALAALAAALAIACWQAGLLPSSLKTFALHPQHELVTPGFKLGLIAISAFSFAIALARQRLGARQYWISVIGGLVAVVLLSIIASQFLGIDFLTTPLLVSGVLTVFLIQASQLWSVDQRLTRLLLITARETRANGAGAATDRLLSGLRLLGTVLPLSEAVVFEVDADVFRTVARLKGVDHSQTEASRNSLWREAVRLCERAIALGQVTVQQVDGQGASRVAVPLRHAQETVGALLIRLNAEFCDDDKALLEAVASQFARNLKRERFAKDLGKNSSFSYVSQTIGREKLDALYVLQAMLTEQRCEANAFSGLSQGIGIAHLDGTFALTNSQLLSFAQLTEEEAKQLDLFSLLHLLRTDVFDEPALAVRRVLQTGTDYECELNFPDRNQILGLRISLLREKQKGTNQDEPIGLGIYVHDVSGVKEYDKLKSDMISLMSHELRTPITSINGFAELLSVDETLPEQAKEFVTIIANEAQRLSRMINTFLAVSQLQRKDKQEVLKIPLRLDEVVRDIIATLQPVAKKKRIRLVEQPANRLPPVAADRSLITQAVKNLVDNAIKYSPERTTVTLSTALEAETVRLSVEDRGFGIPSESKDRVWDKFYRVVRAGQKKDEESTGLGLSFVREVVEQHGGRVELDSEEGRGSKFSFTLPRL
jgi:signal transduction histidine kinase